MVEALEGSEPRVFWLNSPDAPEPLPSLEGERRCRLAVVGGGFTGLWAALLAAERGEDVALLEADRCGWGASRRNGGFLEASLTRGSRTGCRAGRRRSTGSSRWPRASTRSAGSRRRRKRRGPTARTCSCSTARRCEPRSTRPPTWPVSGSAGASATVDPARLAWGLRPAALEDGARIFERSLVRRLGRDGGGVRLETERGRLRTERVVLATNAYPPLLRSIRRYVIPVYHYVLVTESLSAARRAAVGWERRQGLADSGNRFHYYRLTPDDRSLWGGYEAIYHFRNGMAPRLEEHRPTFELLARNFARTSRNSRASASRTAGRGRSTRARASASPSAQRSAAARRTRSATPAWE